MWLLKVKIRAVTWGLEELVLEVQQLITTL